MPVRRSSFLRLRQWLSKWSDWRAQMARRLDRFTDKPQGRHLRRWILRLPGVDRWKLHRIFTRRYARTFGRQPNLAQPRLFTEYITHRIVYDRDPLLKLACDKLAVREYVGRTAGSQYVAPLLGAWRRVDRIDWLALPLPMVLKPNNQSGLYEIVRHLNDLDRLKSACAAWLEQDYFDRSLEWGYRGLPRRILAEPLLRAPDGGSLIEVLAFTFHGQPLVLLAVTGDKRDKRRFCTANLDARGGRLDLRGTAHVIEEVLSPDQQRRFLAQVESAREEILAAAARVGAAFPYVRVDFYITDQGLKIGELTPYPAGGRGRYSPPDWDARLGEMLRQSATQRPRRRKLFRTVWPPLD